jgi:hypothetical protein
MQNTGICNLKLHLKDKSVISDDFVDTPSNICQTFINENLHHIFPHDKL